MFPLSTLFTDQSQQYHPNGSQTNLVSSIYLLSCSLSTFINHSFDPTNLVSSIYPIYWTISTFINQMIVQQILFPLSTLLTVHYPHSSTIPLTLKVLFPLSTLFTVHSEHSFSILTSMLLYLPCLLIYWHTSNFNNTTHYTEVLNGYRWGVLLGDRNMKGKWQKYTFALREILRDR